MWSNCYRPKKGNNQCYYLYCVIIYMYMHLISKLYRTSRFWLHLMFLFSFFLRWGVHTLYVSNSTAILKYSLPGPKYQFRDWANQDLQKSWYITQRGGVPSIAHCLTWLLHFGIAYGFLKCAIVLQIEVGIYY